MSELPSAHLPLTLEEIEAAKKQLNKADFSPITQLEIEDAYLAEQNKAPIVESTPDKIPELADILQQDPSETDDPEF